MARLKRWEHWFVKANQAVIAAAMAIMATLVMVNVVCRYILGDSLAWTEEVSRFLMIGITYLGAGLALREGRLVAVEFFQDLFPKFLLPLRAIVALTILAFLIALAWLGFAYARFAAGQETPVLGISASIPYMIVPFGALVLGMHLLLMFREFLARDWDVAGDSNESDISNEQFGRSNS